MTGTLLRRAAIFGTLACLGILLAALVAGGDREGGRSGPRLPVVPVPAGTEIRASEGVPGISLLGARSVLVSDARDIVLEDGSRVPFRAMVLRGDAERPLPSPGRGVRRVAIDNPGLQMLPVPKTRAEYEASAGATPLRLSAPHGILDQGPGEAMLLRLSGGVRVDLEHEGTPWTFHGDAVDYDLQAHTLSGPGRVRISSPDLVAEGTGLQASETGGTLVIGSGARGTVTGAAGARIGGGAGRGDTRFACSGPLRIERAPREGGSSTTRILLRDDASIRQEDGSIAARTIGILLASDPAAKEGGHRIESVEAEGEVVLSGGAAERSFLARGQTLLARPLPGGNTDVRLEGDPSLEIAEGPGGRRLQVTSRGPAALSLPEGKGPLRALFRGSAAASVLEPGRDGGPGTRRDLTARTLHFAGDRGEEGAGTTIREVKAEGDAELREGERRARAQRITWTPEPDGGSRAVLSESVSVFWPGAGRLDPLGLPGEAAPGSGDPGSLLLAAPRDAVLVLPPEGDGTRFTTVAVTGGAVLRRIVGEREVWRLTCGRIDGAFHPRTRGLSRLEASVEPRIEGREEGPGERRYQLRGDRLVVTGDEEGREPATALLTGAGERLRARASFTGEDGRPFHLEADAIDFDRRTGAFLARGDVRGTGVLPERSGAGPAGGAADLACASLTGVLDRGASQGSTRVRWLEAREKVWVRTASEFASGERLRWEAGEGSILLHGSPARVTARSGAAALGLEDAFEAPTLRLLLAEGRLEEARADGGGLFVRHRVPDAPAGGAPPPAERFQGRCSGPLLYRPAETLLAGKVSLARAVREGGEFREKDRLEGADRVRFLHPPGAAATSGAGRVTGAEALSPGGGISVVSSAGKWKASGVSSVVYGAEGDTVTLEASPPGPRFRMESETSTLHYRRVVYDYVRRTVTEQVGASLEAGR